MALEEAQHRIQNYMAGSGFLDLSNIGLTVLPDLPQGLTQLNCSHNQLTSLPDNIPSSLTGLYCIHNQLTSLPSTLPIGMVQLYCSYNRLTSLPNNLPNNITQLCCSFNQLTRLPDKLPDCIDTLICSDNQLIFLPDVFPITLTGLFCGNNHLNYITHNLPDGLWPCNFECDGIGFLKNYDGKQVYGKYAESTRLAWYTKCANDMRDLHVELVATVTSLNA